MKRLDSDVVGIRRTEGAPRSVLIQTFHVWLPSLRTSDAPEVFDKLQDRREGCLRGVPQNAIRDTVVVQ